MRLCAGAVKVAVAFAASWQSAGSDLRVGGSCKGNGRGTGSQHLFAPCPALSAVLLLTQGKEWREALRVAYSNSRPDLVDTLVAPQAAQAAAAALEGERRVGQGRLVWMLACSLAHRSLPCLRLLVNVTSQSQRHTSHLCCADINENIERVAKYGQRLTQLSERRAAMEVRRLKEGSWGAAAVTGYMLLLCCYHADAYCLSAATHARPGGAGGGGSGVWPAQPAAA